MITVTPLAVTQFATDKPSFCEFKKFDQGKVVVVLQGSCSGCPSSTVTLKAGIEGMLKRMVPEVTEVVAEMG